MTVLEVLDIILRESAAISLDTAEGRRRVRDGFEYLMRCQRADGYVKMRNTFGGEGQLDDHAQPLFRLGA